MARTKQTRRKNKVNQNSGSGDEAKPPRRNKRSRKQKSHAAKIPAKNIQNELNKSKESKDAPQSSSEAAPSLNKWRSGAEEFILSPTDVQDRSCHDYLCSLQL